MLRRYLIFAKFLKVYIEFCLSLFSISERLTYYVLKYDNFKSVEVQGWTPLKILIFLHWTLRPTFTTLLGKRRAISHWMGVPKNRGKCKSATISLHRGDSLSMSSVVWVFLEVTWRLLKVEGGACLFLYGCSLTYFTRQQFILTAQDLDIFQIRPVSCLLVMFCH